MRTSFGAAWAPTASSSWRPRTARRRCATRSGTSRGQGDRIDLSAIDADRRDGYDNDAFRYVGTDAFSGAAGELRYGRVAGGVIVQADTNGDRVADMAFLVAGNQALLASDFLL